MLALSTIHILHYVYLHNTTLFLNDHEIWAHLQCQAYPYLCVWGVPGKRVNQMPFPHRLC